MMTVGELYILLQRELMAGRLELGDPIEVLTEERIADLAIAYSQAGSVVSGPRRLTLEID